MKNASIIVAGHDNVGIIAGISELLSQSGVNICDISQTVMNDHFTMVILADLTDCTVPAGKLQEALEKLGDELDLSVRMQSK